MNKILKYAYFATVVFLVANLAACVKDRNTNATDFGNLQPIVEIRDNISGLGNDAGLSNFARASLVYPATDEADTAYFYINLASVYALKNDLKVTIGFDNAALEAYNANPANTVNFDAMADSLFLLAQTQFTILAGERVALVPVIFYPSKFDPSKSYMLPLSITDAEGVNISGNFGTIYYHSIGNPSAGTYNYVESDPPTRYNYIGQITYTYPGPYPGGYSIVDLTPYYPKTASPVDPNTISFPYSTGFANLLITQDPVTHAITNIAIDNTTVSNFLVYFSSYDDATKTFHIISHYNNVASPPGSGNDRIIDETFTKQ